MEYIEPLSDMDRIEHAIKEAYLAAGRAHESLERFKAHSTALDDPEPFAPLLTELTSGLLFHKEAREWIDLAVTIFAEAKLEAENGDD